WPLYGARRAAHRFRRVACRLLRGWKAGLCRQGGYWIRHRDVAAFEPAAWGARDQRVTILQQRAPTARRALGEANAGGPNRFHRMDPWRQASPPAVSGTAHRQGTQGSRARSIVQSMSLEELSMIKSAQHILGIAPVRALGFCSLIRSVLLPYKFRYIGIS